MNTRNIIHIRGTQLSLVNIGNSIKCDTALKKSIYYQIISEIKNNPLVYNLDNYNYNFVDLKKVTNISISSSYEYFWIVKKTSNKKYENIIYNKSEIVVLLKFSETCLISNYIPLAEGLILASGIKSVINSFYSYFGEHRKKKCIDTIKETIINIGRIPDTSIQISNKVPMYDRSRYSIYTLLNDLLKDNAKFMIPKDLFGTDYCYVTDEGNIINLDNWRSINNIVGNSSRANLSIKSGNNLYCIIQDGILKQDKILVRVSNKLRGKLKRIKNLIDLDNVITSNDLVLNLTNLPIISKSKLQRFSIRTLSEILARIKISKIMIEYLRYEKGEITNNNSSKSPSNVETNMENKDFIKTDKKINKLEVIGKILDLGGISKTKRISAYNCYLNNTKSQEPVINNSNIFTILSINNNYKKLLNKNKDELLNYWISERDKYSLLLKDKIFRLILSKELKFSDKHQPYILTCIVCKTNVYGVTVNVSWKLKDTKE